MASKQSGDHTKMGRPRCGSVLLKQLEFIGQGPGKGGSVKGAPEVHVEIQLAESRQNSTGLSRDHL